MRSEDDLQLHHALKTFEQIMEHRSNMYLRLSGRVRTVVRGGMLLFALCGTAMSLLLYTFISQIEHAHDVSARLSSQVNVMSGHMKLIDGIVNSMETRFTLLSEMGEHVHSMTSTTATISSEMTGLDEDMNNIRGHMSHINGRLAHINSTIGNMGQAVNGMGHSASQMARPASMFPFR